MASNIKLFLIFVFALNLNLINAQETKPKRVNYTALPIVYFTPETSFAFGGLFNTVFYLQELDKRPSFVLLGGAYTLNKQLLLYAPYEFNWGGNKYISKGEIGYYRYFYNYYGIGPNTNGDFEIYTVNFPRFRTSLAYGFQGYNYLGIKYNFDNYAVQELDPEGSLLNDNIAGANGSVISTLGLFYSFDSRDNIYSPESGWFLTLTGELNAKFLKSNFNFQRLKFDASYYLKTNSKSVFAFNLYGGSMSGEIPFQEYLLYGGSFKGRGYYEGRLRDKNLLMIQTEWRYNFYKKFGMTLFGTLGNVSSSFSSLQVSKPKYNYGLGLRYMINRQDKLNIRVDYAFGKETSGLYITFGEAF